MSETRAFALLAEATYLPTSANEVLVKGGTLEGFSMLVEDPGKRGLAASLIQNLGTGRTLGELEAAHSEVASADDLVAILDILVANGAIKEIAAADVSPEAAWAAFVRFGELPQTAQLTEITVLCSGDAEPVLSGARTLGVPFRSVRDLESIDWSAFSIGGTAQPDADVAATIPMRREGSLVVHLSLDGSRAEAMRINEQAAAAGIPVLYAVVDGVDFRLGPFVVPGRTACLWETERQWARASADRPQYETLMRLRDSGLDSPSTSSIGQLCAAAALAPWLLELSLRRTSSLAGEAVHGRATTTEVSRHSVMRLPRCPVCLPLQPLLRNPLY